MRTLLSLRSKALILMAAALALVVTPARAHVMLDDPNGGEQLTVGSVFTITWHVLIQHNQLNWDLWYSTISSAGAWTTIAMDLPPGSPAVGSVHTYDWTIPDVVDDSVWVRVRMDNAGTDYFDVSNAPFSIISADCNGNGVPDDQDIAKGTSEDCNGNGIPDECIELESDCNTNDIPDACDIADGTSEDCNGNGIPDECIEMESDCNTNDIPDACDIAGGTSLDVNGNGIPDECECLPDLSANGAVDTTDLLLLLFYWGPVPPNHPADFDGDGNVGTTDLLILLSRWGPCPK